MQGTLQTHPENPRRFERRCYLGLSGVGQSAKWLRGLDLNQRPLGYEPCASFSFLLLPVAISSYPLCTLTDTSFSMIVIHTPQIMLYFEAGWVQKWVQLFEVRLSVEAMPHSSPNSAVTAQVSY